RAARSPHQREDGARQSLQRAIARRGGHRGIRLAMDAWLAHPAVQAAVLPFLVALLVAAALRKTRHVGLAITAAFLCAAAFTLGLQFESLTAVKKVVLAVIAAGALGAILQSRHAHVQRMDRMIITIGVALAVLWELQRILLQQPP